MGVEPTDVEVVALYGNTVLDVQHLRASTHYSIGESPGVSLVVPPAGLPDPGRFDLVRDQVLRFSAAMDGTVQRGTQTSTLDALIREGHTTRCGSVFHYPLRAGEVCTIQLGAISFRVRAVPRGTPIGLRRPLNRPVWASNVWSSLLFASVLIPAYLATPQGSVREEQLEFARAPVQPFSTRTEVAFEDGEPGLGAGGPGGHTEAHDGALEGSSVPSTRAPDSGLGRSSEGAGGGRGRGRTRSTSQHGERGRGRQTAPRGGRGTPSPDVPAEGNRAAFRTRASCGTHDLLAMKATPRTLPWMVSVPEPCPLPFAGGVPQMARNFDPSMAARSAAILATMNERPDFMSLPLAPTPPAVRIRQGSVRVKGSLDRDLVRRILRAHLNEVRHCYAEGLERTPSLRGRVVVDFTVDGRGRVSRASISSTSRDRRVERCITAAVRRWKFPKPQHGTTVRVTYPFVLGG